jgi:putative PIG3 family NAD(P)H quinone oxidoreductase
MRVVQCGTEGTAESLYIAEAPRPAPGRDEILIEVHCAGVNRPDILQRQGAYPPPQGASPILGLEVAGRVAELGADVDLWQLGDELCALVPGGGYAEYCVAPARHALPIPAGLTLVQAASLPEVWFTVWANLVDLAHLRAGERVLIHGGSSGIGLAAIQLAGLRQAQPFVTVGSEDKARFCRDFGAAAAIDYHREDFVARTLELTVGEGVDVVLDMVGAAYLAGNLRVLRRDGRLVLIGFMSGSRSEINLATILTRRLHVTGSTLRPRSVQEKAAIRDALAAEVWPGFASGRLKTHLHATFPLEQVAEAHRLMQSSEHIGKIVLEVR